MAKDSCSPFLGRRVAGRMGRQLHSGQAVFPQAHTSRRAPPQHSKHFSRMAAWGPFFPLSKSIMAAAPFHLAALQHGQHVLRSLLSAVLVSSQQTLDTFRFWRVGSVSGRDWDTILSVLPFLAAGALITLFAGRVLNGLSLGDDVARGLGQRVGLSRAVTALGVVLLCGAATAAAGPIAFVGLVIPHVVRSFTGPDYRWILPFSMLLAPALLVSADVAGRGLLPPGEIPVGITTAVIGAPVFIWLVRRRKLAEL